MTRQQVKIYTVLALRAGQWVPLPELLSIGVAQYNARILELRRQGLTIENKTAVVNGQRHSWFRLIPRPPRPVQMALVSEA
ncbi:MAG: hypothetical protein ACRD2K_05395 [Terriglobales bacterium]